MIGQRLGHYQVLEKLGQGGMGEVYRATDEILGREVAIKVLPEAFTSDPERLARFEREAKLLASLNHPHIAQIHALEEFHGRKLLVMELVAGRTLAERLADGAIQIDSVLQYALQVSQALEAAHERGIVHRDLKPHNIKLTPDGEIKVLDFGLAKPVMEAASGDLSHSPTLTYSPTQAGVLLGTVGYMSPEQARGKEVDKRTDIWAFGVVVWEMLTGRWLFDGETVSDLLAAVLRAEIDWNELPAATPRPLRRVLQRCLTRDAKDRLHDIADARIEIEAAIAGPASRVEPAAAATARASSPRQRLLWFGCGAALAALLAVAISIGIRPRPAAPDIQRFQLTPPGGVAVRPTAPAAGLAISADGRWVAFLGEPVDPPGPHQIFLRAIGELEARPVEGTEGASTPFFSPDNAWLGFEVDGVLKKAPVGGGQPFPLCDAPTLRGATWSTGGTILFASDRALLAVSAQGGEPHVVSRPDRTAGELSHRWPHFLPDGRTALFLIRMGTRERYNRVALLSLETGEYRTLLAGGTYPRYLEGGFLLYSRLGSLQAVAFDVDALAIDGEPRRVLENLDYHHYAGAVAYDVSRSGSLVFVPGAGSRLQQRELVWLDRAGSVEPLFETAQPYSSRAARLAPDGRRLAVGILSSVEDNDVWVADLERSNWTRLTFEGGWAPTWSPDGAWIAFDSDPEGSFDLYRIAADVSGPAERLTADLSWDTVGSFSPDGRFLAFARQTLPSNYDLYVLPLAEGSDSTAQPFLVTAHNENSPQFSPDGRWIAYHSSESGALEVYLRSFPDGGTKTKVSTSGGNRPRWGSNGRSLFYRSPDGDVWEARIETEPRLAVGQPVRAFSAPAFQEPLPFDFEVSHDGERLLLLRSLEESAADLRLVYIPDWSDELSLLLEDEE